MLRAGTIILFLSVLSCHNNQMWLADQQNCEDTAHCWSITRYPTYVFPSCPRESQVVLNVGFDNEPIKVWINDSLIINDTFTTNYSIGMASGCVRFCPINGDTLLNIVVKRRGRKYEFQRETLQEKIIYLHISYTENKVVVDTEIDPKGGVN